MTAKPAIRRIVTGHDENNIARVITDDVATNTKQAGTGAVSTLIWCTDGTPANIEIGENFEDMGARIVGTQPPPMGSRFAVIEFPPGEPTRMHRTESIDYVLCLAGKIDMDMDESTVTMEAGDVMVQRGTNHAWVNRYDEPARVAFVLIDAVPLNIGEPVAHGANAGDPQK
ncbi:MAG: cupin domain-containing protein [Alphaproteobacteria bacterium]